MRSVRSIAVVVALAAAGAVPLVAAPVAHAAGTVSLDSDSADINAFEFADGTNQTNPDTNGSSFISFGNILNPAKESATEGTATAFVSEAATMETPGQPPFPISPLNDIAVDGKSTSATTATFNGPAVPVSDSNGSLSVSFTTSNATPVFFSGILHTTNTDTVDHSCSSVTVDLNGEAGFSRHFAAETGACSFTGSRQAGFAQSLTLPADSFTLDVAYGSALDDDPGESTSLTASATESLNLAFFPPTARFTKTLSGYTAHFDGSGSSVGDSTRSIAKWKWTFGDGKSATTTSAKVGHIYPKSPAIAPTYRVTLQVVDSDGGLSPPVSHNVLGTATSLGVSKTSGKEIVSGTVKPNRAGHHVIVTLARKRSGSFHNLATHKPTLTSTSHYATSFARPVPGTCRITTVYPGDSAHLASEHVKVFSC